MRPHPQSHPTLRSAIDRLAFLVVLASCARQALPGTSADSAQAAPSARADRNMLTKSMFNASRFTTAYEAVEALRSNWLRARGPDSFQKPSQVRIYLDNVSLGDPETLKTITIQSVEYFRYFDAASATARWGLDHAAGVIFVSTRPLASDP